MNDIAVVIIGFGLGGVAILGVMTVLYYFVKLGAKVERKIFKNLEKE